MAPAVRQCVVQAFRAANEALRPAKEADLKVRMTYWHRDLPPIDAQPMGEHIIEADSPRIAGTIARAMRCGMSATRV